MERRGQENEKEKGKGTNERGNEKGKRKRVTGKKRKKKRNDEKRKQEKGNEKEGTKGTEGTEGKAQVVDRTFQRTRALFKVKGEHGLCVRPHGVNYITLVDRSE